MEEGVLQLVAGLMSVGVGWLHLRQTNLEKKIEDKVDQEDFNELKTAVRNISDHVMELKVDQARCLTILEGLERNSSKKD